MNDWRDNHLVTNTPAPTEPTYLSVVISLVLFLLCTRGFLFMCNGNGYFTFQATGMSAPIDLTVILWLSVACSFVDGSAISEYILNVIKGFDTNHFLTERAIILIKSGMLLILMSAALSCRYNYLTRYHVNFTNISLMEKCYKLVFYVPAKEALELVKELETKIENVNKTKEDQKQ